MPLSGAFLVVEKVLWCRSLPNSSGALREWFFWLRTDYFSSTFFCVISNHTYFYKFYYKASVSKKNQNSLLVRSGQENEMMIQALKPKCIVDHSSYVWDDLRKLLIHTLVRCTNILILNHQEWKGRNLKYQMMDFFSFFISWCFIIRPRKALNKVVSWNGVICE